MNKNLLLLAVVAILLLVGYQVIAKQILNKEVKMSDKKVLIAYYSYSGNTESVAKKIQAKVGGDLFKIETVNAYPTAYNDVVEQAKKEKAEDFHPQIKGKVENIKDYNVIFLGSPVWWYTMAPAVKTFLAENNLEGKVIVPFCTHGGGGASSTFSDMAKLAPKSSVKKGFVVYNRGTASTDNDISDWLGNLDL